MLPRMNSKSFIPKRANFLLTNSLPLIPALFILISIFFFFLYKHKWFLSCAAVACVHPSLTIFLLIFPLLLYIYKFFFPRLVVLLICVVRDVVRFFFIHSNKLLVDIQGYVHSHYFVICCWFLDLGRTDRHTQWHFIYDA